MLRHDEVFAALAKAGIIGDASQVNRVVIDAVRGQYVRIHIELVGDKNVLDVVRTLDGVTITEEPRDPGLGGRGGTNASWPGPGGGGAVREPTRIHGDPEDPRP